MLKTLEQQIIDSLEDEEIEDKIPTYQVWAFELDKDRNYIDDKMIKSFDDPEKAVAFAKTLTLPDEHDSDSVYYEIIVETVVDFGDYTENIASLFHEVFEFDFVEK